VYLSSEGDAKAWTNRAYLYTTATKRRKYGIIRVRQFKALRSAHRFGNRWNVGSLIGKSHDGVENAPIGRIFFRGSYRASYSLTGNTDEDCALFLCP